MAVTVPYRLLPFYICIADGAVFFTEKGYAVNIGVCLHIKNLSCIGKALVLLCRKHFFGHAHKIFRVIVQRGIALYKADVGIRAVVFAVKGALPVSASVNLLLGSNF